MVGILDISATLRRQIFTHAGLFVSENVDLARKKNDTVLYSWYHVDPSSFYCPSEKQQYYLLSPRRDLDGQLPIRLMLSCRAFYHDVLVLLSTTNHFFIDLDNQSGNIDLLQRLPNPLVSNIRSLAIFLRTSMCKWFPCDHSWQEPSSAYQSDLPMPLSIANPEDLQLIHKWHNLWQRWAQILPIRPVLNLKLVCDVDDRATARAVLEPFLSSRPLFKHCTIRLNGQPFTDVRDIADAAVISSTSSAPSDQTCHHTRGNADAALTPTTSTPRRPPDTFPFFDLPAEIRHRILMQTDLVVNDGWIHWRPAFHVDKRRPGNDPATSASGSKSDNLRWPCGPCYEKPYALFGCLCQATHTVASNDPAFAHCVELCWMFPVSLLLTCRQLYAEAMAVFLQGNTIAVMPPWRKFHDDDGFLEPLAIAPLAAASFLKRLISLPSHCLRELIIIQEDLACPRLVDVCAQGSAVEQDWIDSLTAVAARGVLNLPQLTISVLFLFWKPLSDYGSVAPPDDFDVEASLACYANIVRPIRLLEGLGRFFIHLPRDDELEEWTRVFDYESEAMLERLVMGEGYDAWKVGKKPMMGRELWGQGAA